ncbi:MAG: CPBP family intramembrane metalloprotease [Gudongella sp.]|nr:CPBP family intramembrane metalloprotease [Gudongella sp.]
MKKIMLISIFSVVLMSLVDGFINPGYGVKSAIKVVLFFLVPIISAGRVGTKGFRELLRPTGRKAMGRSIALGLGVYAGIMAVYFILRPYIDLDTIRVALEDDLGVNRENFILVALYISFMNSLLEEFFFRGYLFLGLLQRTGRLMAYSVSAFLFAAYHVAIIGTWFSPLVFMLAMTGLFVGGLIFNYLNERNRNIINSWVVHLMANLAINTVGLIMFGMVP